MALAGLEPVVQSPREVYLRLKAKGKPEKVARVAAARKLLLIAHAIYKSSEPYRALQEVTT